LSSGIDYVVIGEGEETIRELLDAIQGKQAIDKVKGIAYLDHGQVILTLKESP